MSLTVAGIVSVVIFCVIVYSSYRNGLYSTAVTLFVIALSGAAAFLCLGPVPRMMLFNRMGWYAPAVCFLGVFLLSLVVLQTLANYLLPPRVMLPKAVDDVGGAALGVVNACALTGVLMIGFGLIPGTGGPEDKTVFLYSDVLVAKSMSWLSHGAGSTTLDADEFLRRVRKEKTFFRPKARPDDQVYDENYQCAQRLGWLGKADRKSVV